MKDRRITSLAEYIELCTDEDHGCGHVVYRGVSDAKNHKLVPTIGRISRFKDDAQYDGELEDQEKEILEAFKRKSRGTITPTPENDFEWMALAQHHGLPTRLLDWTVSPLVALHFATSPRISGATGELLPPDDHDAAVYAFHE